MDQQILDKLRTKGLKCTPQRIDIIKEILDCDEHCTVEFIYEKAKAKHPGLSISTVYRTLETLVEIGELRIVNVGRFKNFYDKKLDTHHHIVCIKCGKIEDIPKMRNCHEMCLDNEHKNNYTIIDSSNTFNAICDTCRLKGIK